MTLTIPRLRGERLDVLGGNPVLLVVPGADEW
jgi:hypothetical protein